MKNVLANGINVAASWMSEKEYYLLYMQLWMVTVFRKYKILLFIFVLIINKKIEGKEGNFWNDRTWTCVHAIPLHCSANWVTIEVTFRYLLNVRGSGAQKSRIPPTRAPEEATVGFPLYLRRRDIQRIPHGKKLFP